MEFVHPRTSEAIHIKKKTLANISPKKRARYIRNTELNAYGIRESSNVPRFTYKNNDPIGH